MNLGDALDTIVARYMNSVELRANETAEGRFPAVSREQTSMKSISRICSTFFFFQAEDGIRDRNGLEFRRVLFRSPRHELAHGGVGVRVRAPGHGNGARHLG